MDSEHSALYQCLESRSAADNRSLVLTASGGPSGARPRGARRRRPRGGTCAPDLEHGPEDHDRLGHARQQRTRADRGAFPLRRAVRAIEIVVHPTSVVHSLVRFRDGAALAHLGYPDMRVPISYALTYPERALTPVPTLDLASGLTLESTPPTPTPFPCSPSPARPACAAGTFPCAFNAANEVAVAAFLEGPHRLPRDRRDRRAHARHRLRRRGADLDELTRADAEARRDGRGPRSSLHELRDRPSWGLAFLILIHEAGHFFVVARGRDAASQVLHRLPARTRQGAAERHRVRHRRDPARRLRPASRGCTVRPRRTSTTCSRAPSTLRPARRSRPSA